MSLQITGAPLEFTSVVDDAQFREAIRRMEGDLKKLTTTAKKEGGEIEGFARNAARALAAYGSLGVASNFVKDIARVRGEFQQLEVAFETMLGSKAKSDALMTEITQFAATTPFELSDVAGATRSLLAFGLSAENVKSTLTSIGDISAGVGAPIKEIAELYGKAKVQGRLFMEDVNQLTGRGIPIIQEFAKQFNVADGEVRGLVEAGKIGFPQLEAAFKNLTSTGSKFGGLMEAQSKTITGMISNLQDSWAQMLNSIGQDNEGVIAGTIQMANTIVQNFETVLDILTVLISTYGAYKAATIASSVVTLQYSVATRSLSVAQTLQATASIIAQRAMALLNVTMKANPAGLLIATLAALATAMYAFRDTTIEVKTSQELLADSQERVGKALADTKAKIEPYLQALKNANISEGERLEIYNKLKEIDPKIVAGIDAKSLSYQSLTANVKLYLKALKDQLWAEENQAAVAGSLQKEREILKELATLQGEIDKYSKRDGTAAALLLQQAKARYATMNELLIQQKQATRELGKNLVPKLPSETKPGVVVSNKEIIDQKTSLEDLAAFRKSLEERYQKETDVGKRKALADDLKYSDTRKKALDVYGAAKESAKGLAKEEGKQNQLLEERKGILQAIADMRRDAAQTGLAREQSELAKINQRYDEMFRKISEFNEKARKARTAGIGQSDIQALERSRQLELSNQNLKEDAVRYAKSLEEKKAIFERYEEAKKEIGDQAAADMYREQAGGFSTYLDLLKVEFAKVAPKVVLGVANVGDMKAYETLLNAIKDTEAKSRAEAQKKEEQELAHIFQISATYKARAAAIEMQYNERVAIAKKRLQGDELKNALAALAIQRDTAIKDAQAIVIQNGALYQKLGQNLLSFNRADLKQRIAELKSQLGDTTLTPKMKLDVDSAIQEAEGLLAATADGVDEANKFGSSVEKLRQGFDAVASSVEGINGGLAASIRLLANVSGNLVNAASQYKAFKQAQEIGDTVGQVSAGLGIAGAAIGVATSIASFFKSAKEQRKAAQADAQSWMDAIKRGEEEINAVYRERAREQVRINDLKLQGLVKEKDLLEAQQKAVSKQYQDLFKQLQNQTAVIGKTVERGGFLGLGTRSRDITASLAGKSFEELERLFTQGQLTGKAKELFEQLQKIKQEGVDIDKLLDENRAAAAQVFTGTTSDSITDTIVDGFAKGFTAVEQFADSTEDIIRKAMLNALKYQALEGPIKKLYEKFAADAESGGGLDTGEVQSFTDSINKTIQDAALFAEQIQKATGVNLAAAGGGASGANSLTGAVKGITEQQADLLAGQFGGLRITNLEMLKVGQMALTYHQEISINTAATVNRLDNLIRKFDQYETGARTIHIT